MSTLGFALTSLIRPWTSFVRISRPVHLALKSNSLQFFCYHLRKYCNGSKLITYNLVVKLDRDCTPTTKTVLERVCLPKVEKVCKSVIEETTEERCKV